MAAIKRRAPARRGAKGGEPGGLLPRRLWLLAVVATVALYWTFLLRIGGVATARARPDEGVAASDGLDSARDMAEQLYNDAEGANLRRNDEELVATQVASDQETDAPVATKAAQEPEKEEEEVVPFEQRHVTLSGYDATLAFLESYTKPEGSDEELFLFFVCSDEQGREYDWRRLCAEAKEVVYEVFAKSPSSKRLVTIYAGSKTDWTTKNKFFDDQDLRVKAIPSVMKWEGGSPSAKRATSDMMIESTLLYEPLLRYVFGNKDKTDPLLDPDDVATKEIVDLKGFQEYSEYMQKYNADPSSKPMYLMLISGRMQGNDRLWCPYCRYSHVSVEYGFYAYAPRGARLVRVETYPSYGQWKVKNNDFKRDTNLNVRGVPAFYRIYPAPGKPHAIYNRVVERWDQLEPLKVAFEGL